MATNTRSYSNCALVNIQSVGNKTFEIREDIMDNKLDILMLTETWLNVHDTAKEKTKDARLLRLLSVGGVKHLI